MWVNETMDFETGKAADIRTVYFDWDKLENYSCSCLYNPQYTYNVDVEELGALANASTPESQIQN